MTGNFEFLKTLWPDLYETAAKAEKNTFTDPWTCALYCRFTLEQTVNWIYDHDSSLKRPFQDNLGALLLDKDFVQNLGSGLALRIRFIQQLGNHAAHKSRNIRDHQSLKSLQSLHALCCWLIRTYSKNPPLHLLFKESLIPKKGEREKSAKQLKQLQDQLAEKNKLLEEERKKYADLLERQKDAFEKEKQRLLEIQQIKIFNEKTLPEEDYTEEETRELFIDLLLREAGWDTDSRDVSTEYEVNGMPNKSGTGNVDYVLWGKDGLPLAVVEAKRTKLSEKKGKYQAELYANCLENSTGQRPVIFYTNGYNTWLWDDASCPPREVQGFYTADQLQLLILRRTTRKPLEDMEIDTSIVNRNYHFEGIRRVTEHFSEGHRKGLVVMATGAGKTQFSIALVKLLMQANWVRRVLFLADRITLVRQAKNKFTEFYPDASTVNLLEEKEDDTSRIVFSTYPTMMNRIDEDMRGKDRKRFGVGHFDLIIVDEAHRSIYLKYRAIFNYFDALLLGLTATPKAEVDRNTYSLFDLSDNMPTYFYELERAVREGYLVPFKAMEIPLKFPQQGIRYDDLSEEEKEEYEAKFYDDKTGEMPKKIKAAHINKWLFNNDTIDKVLAHLMEFGLKVQGGDRLGKTIIFAKNQEHADFIVKRFDKQFPRYKGGFTRTIHHAVDYSHNLIEDFSLPEKKPFIAVSVDMLDTGIDIHEIVNLVFFKNVWSRAKFRQMLGRGTRTRKNLFGPGKDKEYFLVFDFCKNFTFFAEIPEGIEPSAVESLSQKIFKKRLFLTHYLGDTQGLQDPDKRKLRDRLTDILHRSVKELDCDSFLVRPHRKYVEKYSRRDRWDRLAVTDISDIESELSRLMDSPDPDEAARRFDLIILELQLSTVEQTRFRHSLMRSLQKLAASLSKLGRIPKVNAQMKLIEHIQTDAFRENHSLLELEDIRTALRDLIKFIDKEKQRPVYTAFEDEIGESVEVGGFIRPEKNMEDYRRKMEKYIRDNEDHLTIIKLKTNKPITALDLEQLERMLFENREIGSRDDFRRAYGTDRPLGQFIRSIVGLDREAVKVAFARFTANPAFSADQITFIDYILDYFSRNGYMKKEALWCQPFTDLHDHGPQGIFSEGDVDNIISIIDVINQNAVGM